MDLSVVVATLNGRDALTSCLDALAEGAPAAERIVVNGPSTDGTTGMVRDRDDVDVLLELADRNVNSARNAGAAAATGEAVAFVDEVTRVEPGWADAATRALADTSVVTGPVHRPLPVGSETSRPEHEQVAGRPVTYFDGANVAIARDVVTRLDGFDEYLAVGGARDAAHRLAGLGIEVGWSPDLVAGRGSAEPDRIGDGRRAREYRALAYRLAKNYGTNVDALGRLLRPAFRAGVDALSDVLAGESAASARLSDGAAVAGGGFRGTLDGVRARLDDRRPARNPNGISARDDRVVRRYDWT